MLVSAGPESGCQMRRKRVEEACVFLLLEEWRICSNIWGQTSGFTILKKIVNYLLPFLLLNVPCPFAYSKLFQPTLKSAHPSDRAPPIPQRQRGLCCLWVNGKSVLVWCPRNLTPAPNSVVLSKQFSSADETPQGTAGYTTFPSGGSDCSFFVPPADSWAQSSPS